MSVSAAVGVSAAAVSPGVAAAAAVAVAAGVAVAAVAAVGLAFYLLCDGEKESSSLQKKEVSDQNCFRNLLSLIRTAFSTS